MVVGNPPYVSAKEAKKSYAVKRFRTADCPDIYAMVIERATGICGVGGRTSMIVPLSLGFSRDFSVLRNFMYEQCEDIWFSSFGRIPSALFSFDTRVRNIIYLAKRSSEIGSQHPKYFTTRLHRWFESQRPYLLGCISYSQFVPSAFDGLIPKIGSSRLLQGLQSLLLNGNCRYGDVLSSSKNGAPLHFKKTVYNWLTFCVHKPPIIGSDGSNLTQTEYGTVKFSNKEDRDLSLLLANGLLMFLWWVAIGDDFHLTRSGFASAPFGIKQLTGQQRKSLLDLLPDLKTAMSENVVFKRNAGKNVGNYSQEQKFMSRHLL